jgi:hypothetical protein
MVGKVSLSTVSTKAPLSENRKRNEAKSKDSTNSNPKKLKVLRGRVNSWLSHLTNPIDSLFISRGFFRPKAEPKGTPKSEPPQKLDINCEEVQIKTADKLTLHGYYFKAKEKTENTILYFHGRSGNVNHYYPICLKLQEGLAKIGKSANVLIFDYRGYGKSEGRQPTRKTVLKDAYAAYTFLRNVKSIPSNKICLIGHSSGAAAALGLAVILQEIGEKVNSIIAASSYSSPKAAFISACEAKKKKPSRLLLSLVSNKLLNPEGLVQKIDDIPLIFLHGAKDPLFPTEHPKTLHALANGNKKQLVILEEASHANLFDFLKEEHFKILGSLFDN